MDFGNLTLASNMGPVDAFQTSKFKLVFRCFAILEKSQLDTWDEHSVVVSTHLWNTPLYQRAIKGFLS